MIFIGTVVGIVGIVLGWIFIPGTTIYFLVRCEEKRIKTSRSKKELEDVRGLILQTVEEEENEDPKWTSGLRYAVIIIDKYIEKHKLK